jgi:NADH:ubiquinone oxidoreductase subunit
MVEKKGFWTRALTWWHGQTMNTALWTRRHGIKVGEDQQGNIFYHNADDSRRWVIFNGDVEASRIDVNWHGWLHRTFDEIPSKKPLAHKVWEKPHQVNLTGSDAAHAPSGSMRLAKPADRSDYQAWRPE